MQIEIKEISTKSEKLKFIKSQWLFYKDDPNFVPPIISDRYKLIDTEKNPFYKHSELKLFMAFDSSGNILGRIAGIINYNHNKTHNDKLAFLASSNVLTILMLPENCSNKSKAGSIRKGSIQLSDPKIFR
jgi:hypothetical protein